MTGKNYLSFFSGALGLDIGLEAAGLLPLAVNEIDPVICETIRKNRPNLRLFDCDIREISAERIRRELGINTEDLFAIVGGPPCQAFSTAGRRLGLNDDRGNVFLHFVSLVTALRPKYAVFENVRGLLSAPLRHRPHALRGAGNPPLGPEEQPGGALLSILDHLESQGYSTTFTLYNTANFGVPQVRERLIFFASREGRGIPFIAPTHSETAADGLPCWRTLRDAVWHLRGTRLTHGMFPMQRLRYLSMLREGQNWRDLPKHIQKEAMGKSWHSNGGKTGFYRRLSWDKPAPTLVTRPTMPATALCHPDELRPLAIEEYREIQTFPSDYFFSGRNDMQYLQIGNAVPPRFGFAIGKHLVDCDAGVATSIKNVRMSRYVGTDHESWREQMMASQEGWLF
jgi:DNA (cytosine-5)-methyltransferase 1